MQLTAKLIQLLPLQTGVSKNGEWKKQDIVVETESQYPKKICVSIWGDKINESHLKIGNPLTIHYELESREFNNKWYTDVKAWKIEATNTATIQAPETENYIEPQSHFQLQEEEEEDLPF